MFDRRGCVRVARRATRVGQKVFGTVREVRVFADSDTDTTLNCEFSRIRRIRADTAIYFFNKFSPLKAARSTLFMMIQIGL